MTASKLEATAETLKPHEQLRGQIMSAQSSYQKMLQANAVSLKKQFVNKLFDTLNLGKYKVK